MNRATVRTAAAVLLSGSVLGAEAVKVRHLEGIVHGFLVLRTLDGKAIADGDLIQLARGTRVTTRLTFHFTDGSLHDETAVFTQRGQFRLVSDHLVQKGPTFPHPLDMTIDGSSGAVKVTYTEDGKEKVETDRVKEPVDLANGVLLTLLKNVNPAAPPKSFTFVVATPKPRTVKLELSAAGDEPFATGGERRKAMHYVLKVNIGGVAGVVAPIIGKQPPDSSVWILGGEAPAFVRSEQQLYADGPLWRIELVSPAFQ